MNPDEIPDYARLLQRLHSNPTISVVDAAQLLGIGKSTIYAAAKAGEVPAVRVGHRVRIPSRWVLGVLQLRTHAEDAPPQGGSPKDEQRLDQAQATDADPGGQAPP
ncbi:excisionase family DNA-binding protein [Nocardia sp. NPDC050435]|uniref:excisionase family DNA-binding protein n=1 Tax=Nocardia sp. NPDC050435 TaxID=3155040 RepID=UPI0033E6B3AD